MIQPDQNPPPDWLAYIIKLGWIALAGALGSFFSQLYNKGRKWPQRMTEWGGGALCAIYGAEIVANTIYHLLVKFDLIDGSYVVPEKLLGFAGFLCGVLGVKIIIRGMNIINKYYSK